MTNKDSKNSKTGLKNWTYEFITDDGKVRYLLAPDSMTAAYTASELSGTAKLLDVRLADEWS